MPAPSALPEAVSAPWDLQPGESLKAYQAFRLYRDGGAERSMAKVCQLLGRSARTACDRWASRFDWTGRARAYDADLARRATSLTSDSHAEAAARQARLGRAMQVRAGQRLEKMDAANLTAQEAAAFARAGVQIERDALGMVTAIRTELTGDVVLRIVAEDSDA